MGIFADARQKSQVEADKKRTAEEAAIATAQALIADLKADYGDNVQPVAEGNIIELNGISRALKIVCRDATSFELFDRPLDKSPGRQWVFLAVNAPVSKDEMAMQVDRWLASNTRI